MEPVTMTSFKPGDRILVPWGPDKVAGTVLSLFGSPGEQYARLEIEFPSDVEETEYKLLTLSVKLIERVPRTSGRRA
jgi:primosomal protein N'